MTIYADPVFAPLDADHAMERIAGGNETEVYRTDDHRYVVKLKGDLRGTRAAILAWAQMMRAAAESFAECLGPQHSVASEYVLGQDAAGNTQVLVVQPYIAHAQPLFTVDYAALNGTERAAIARQLRDIIRRSLAFYRANGSMPDLYGRVSSSIEERARLNRPWMLPWRLWSFLVQRNLLRAHNLLVTHAPERRVVLVDYDIVRRGKLYRQVYYAVRWLLFLRDHALIAWMRRGGRVP